MARFRVVVFISWTMVQTDVHIKNSSLYNQNAHSCTINEMNNNHWGKLVIFLNIDDIIHLKETKSVFISI